MHVKISYFFLLFFHCACQQRRTGDPSGTFRVTLYG
jgi:hypothetical protein